MGRYLLSRFHAILANENWSFSDPDPKLIIPDPANNFGSDRIRIHNTAFNPGTVLYKQYHNALDKLPYSTFSGLYLPIVSEGLLAQVEDSATSSPSETTKKKGRGLYF
jgi:hypothetical protein